MRMSLCDPGATLLATPLLHDGMPRLGYPILPLSKLRPYVSVEHLHILDSTGLLISYLYMQMASIGALLDHIVRERALDDFDDDGIGGLDITNIEIISL